MSSCDIEILVAHLPPPLSCTSNFALVRASLLATSMFLGGKVLLEGRELTREYSVAWKWSVSPVCVAVISFLNISQLVVDKLLILLGLPKAKGSCTACSNTSWQYGACSK